MNPNGRVPTIDEDGFVLLESMAINLYLAKQHGNSTRPMRSRSPRLAVELLGEGSVDRQLTTYANDAFALPEAQRDAAAAKAAWDEIAPALDVLEIALKQSQWLAGGEFTVADLNVAAAMYRALFFDLAKWPHVHEWLHRCWDRPAGKRTRAMRE